MTKIRRKRGTTSRRRRERRQRAILIGLSSVCCLAILYLLGLITGWRGGKGGAQLGLQSKLGAPQRLGGRKGKPQRKAAGGTDGLLPMRQALEDPDSDPAATEQARDILAASLNLVNIDFGSRPQIGDDAYQGVIGEFCSLDFSAQKDDPPKLPMFRDVVGHSDCDNENKIVRVDLNEAVTLVREFDVDNAGNLPTLLDLKGVVFHESRCGSTLAANSMQALSPEKHRVYSESSPPITAMKVCGEDYSTCSVEAAANLLRDVIYLMGRSNDPKEERLFFKFQSITTLHMSSFVEAFPTTPWIFLYRQPIEVLMSQLNVPKKAKANCVRAKHSTHVEEFIDQSDMEIEFEDLIDEEFCAIHLASLCESALTNLADSEGLGMAINYHPDLVHDFLDTVFPKHFKTPVDPAGRERVMKISGTYSKNRGRHAEGEFKPDSEAKEKRASGEIRAAAKDFLQPSFKKLQSIPYNIRPGDEDDEEE